MLCLFGTETVALGKAGDAEIVGFAAKGIDVKDDCAALAGLEREIDHATAGELIGRAAEAHFGGAAQGLGGQIGLDAVRDDIDHAADGAAAVEQRRGTADDLDALDEKRLHAYGVVGACHRGIERADAVFEQTDPISAQPADDRPAGAGTKRGGVDAGLGRERFTEGGLLFQQQRAVAEDGRRLGEVHLVAREGRGRGDELVEGDDAVRVRGSGGRVRMRWRSGWRRRWRSLGAREARGAKEQGGKMTKRGHDENGLNERERAPTQSRAARKTTPRSRRDATAQLTRLAGGPRSGWRR